MDLETNLLKSFVKPSFTLAFEDFSIAWFKQSSKFLIVKGDVNLLLSEISRLDSDTEEVSSALIEFNPEIDKLLNLFGGISESNSADSREIYPDLDQLPIKERSMVKFGIKDVIINYGSYQIKTIFEAPYIHLKTNKLNENCHKLSIATYLGNLYFHKNGKLVSNVPKSNYHQLQAQFANTLIEYYHHLESNPWLCSFHACAVQKNNKAYLILGDSGAGKSTLTALLCGSGYRFIGDDLILMDTSFHIYDNPAALSVKENSWRIVSKYHKDMSSINPSNRTKGNIKMKYLPLHLIQDNKPKKHKISALIWVNYKPNPKTQITPLNSIDLCSKLIPDTWVNPESNYPERFAQMIIQSKGYQLNYSDFSSIKSILDEQL